jgi:hypothetical protein
MLRRLRFYFWLLAVLAAGLAAYILTGGAPRRVAVRPAAPASEPELPRVAADRQDVTAAAIMPASEMPWATPDAVAFQGLLELVYANQFSAARSRAKRFFLEYPTSPYGMRVERLTGVQPHLRRVR